MSTLNLFTSESGSTRDRRMAMILEPFIDELADQMAEMDQDQLREYWTQASGLFYWMATGDMRGLTPSAREFALRVEGREEHTQLDADQDEMQAALLEVEAIEA